MATVVTDIITDIIAAFLQRTQNENLGYFYEHQMAAIAMKQSRGKD
jgi:hypothetical protein